MCLEIRIVLGPEGEGAHYLSVGKVADSVAAIATQIKKRPGFDGTLLLLTPSTPLRRTIGGGRSGGQKRK
jgi:hypothetical protein